MRRGLYLAVLMASMLLGGLTSSIALAADTTGPGPVTYFFSHAQDNPHWVTLRWQNPPDADFAATRVLRSTVDYATDANQTDNQTQIFEGEGGGHQDTGLTTGTTYYYT